MKSLYLTFFKEYCRDLQGIGSVVPDSRVCLTNLLKGVPFDSANVILEYGGATGSMTREIIKRKEPATTFVCFEKNARFFNRLKDTIQATNFYLVHDDALRSRQILASELGLTGGKVDCIVSTLPCSCLNFEDLIEQSVLPLLSDRGIFIQYMHLISLFKGFRLDRVLKKYFGRIESKLVFRNLPPVVIYTCRKDGGRMPDLSKIN